MTEPALERPRLDPRQVDAPRGDLREAAHEPAGRRVAGAVEDDRRLELGGPSRRRRRARRALTRARCRRGLTPPARPRGSASRCRARPRCPRRAPGSRRARRPRPCRSRRAARRSPRPPTAPPRPWRWRRSPAGPAAPRPDSGGHWPSGCGCEKTASTSASATPGRTISASEIGSTSSPTIRTRAPASSSASVSSVALTPPSSEFSIGTSAASTALAPAARSSRAPSAAGRPRPRRRRPRAARPAARRA